MHKKLIGAGQCSDKIAGQFFHLKKMLNTYPPTYHELILSPRSLIGLLRSYLRSITT